MMLRWACLILFALIFLYRPGAGACEDTPAAPAGRFFHSGDGRLHLQGKKSGARFQGRYRSGAGEYDPAAYQAICQVFAAPCASNRGLSLRLIEFLDAVEDHFDPGALITITSGYRAPHYNRQLREKGRLAAKASLHQYGMAADLEMAGVPSRRIWEHVKALGFGGTGYYRGRTVHIDVGPTRWWDQKTSGVGTGISDDNKLIGLVTDYDIYRAGDPMVLRFIRMTAFPVGVTPEFTLYRRTGQGMDHATRRFVPAMSVAPQGPCARFGDIAAMDGIRWSVPSDLAPGNFRIGARFCSPLRPKMPAEVLTAVFQVTGSR